MVVVGFGAVSSSVVAAQGAPLDRVSRALAQARLTDQPVVVDQDTTEYSTTAAEPDGTLSSTFSATPQQVDQGGSWVPVDASLQPNADGTLSPAAAANDLTLSDGGAGALATMQHDGTSLALTWPTALPAPTVSGATATYADVMSGVDLDVTADTEGGISETLVVKTPQAAADPALDALKLKVKASGVSLATDGSDNITATGTDGQPEYHAAEPAMWDSNDTAVAGSGAAPTGPSAPPSASADDGDTPPTAPSTTSDTAPVGESLQGSTLTVTPDQSMLDSTPKSDFPIYIDPTFVPTTKNASGWDWAQQAFPSSSHWEDNSQGNPAVGYQGWTSGSYGKNRSFYQYSIGSIGSDYVHDATLNASEIDTGQFDCSSTRKIDVYNVGHISSSTTWNNQPDSYSQQDSATVSGASNDNGCPNRSVNFDVTGAVAADGDGTVTLMLRADDESDKNAYSRYTSSSTSLTIDYDRAPNVPSSPSVSPKPVDPSGNCTSTAGWVPSVSSVSLAAHLSDPDTSTNQAIQGELHLWDKGGDGSSNTDVITTSDSSGYTGTATAKDGGTENVKVPTSKLKNGHEYGFDIWANDSYLTSSSGSDHCYFWYDSTAPSAPASPNFATASANWHSGTTATINLTSADYVPSGAGYSGVDHFDYSTSSSSDLGGDGGTHVAATTSGPTGAASIALNPTTWGVNYLYVAAVDGAGNESAVATYKYYVIDNSKATVNPGDIDGDGRPDVVGVYSHPNAGDGSDGTLQLFTGDPSTGNASPIPASNALNAPNQTSWANTVTAHRSSATRSSTGARVDDLWALQSGALYLYTNNLNNAGGVAGNGGYYFTRNNAVTVKRPYCQYDSTACASYGLDWSTTTQMIAVGDVDGDGIPDLITVDNGALWFFHGSTTAGQLTDPRLLSASGWNNYRLLSPGNASGTQTDSAAAKQDPQGDPLGTIRVPDLWYVPSTPGGSGVYQRQLHVSGYGAWDGTSLQHPDTISLGTASTTNTGSNWGPDAHPLVASPGDGNGDGNPDVYSVGVPSSGPDQLWVNLGTAPTASGTSLASHVIVDDGSTVSWKYFTNLS